MSRRASSTNASSVTRLVLALCLVGALFVGLFYDAPYAYADERVSVVDLSNADESLDGAEVVFICEAIGDIINGHGGFVWVAAGPCPDGRIEASAKEAAGAVQTDDVASSAQANASISVYMTREAAAQISNLGRYHVIGATLEITGVFHLACDEHQGLSDVHASSVRVIDAGGSISEQPDRWLLISGVLLAFTGVLFMLVFRILKERMR